MVQIEEIRERSPKVRDNQTGYEDRHEDGREDRHKDGYEIPDGSRNPVTSDGIRIRLEEGELILFRIHEGWEEALPSSD